MNKIEKHYNNYYKTKNLSHRILANRDVAERLQKSCAQYKISKIIDIGAGTGNLLKEIEKIKLGSEYHAVEINQKSVDLIKKLRIKKLFRAFKFNGYKLPYKKNYFDLAILSHVVEHVEEPRKLINEALRISKLVYIEVPLEDNLKLGNNFIKRDIGHINFYNQKTIRHLAQTCNAKIISGHISDWSFEYGSHIKGAKNFIIHPIKFLMMKLFPNIAPKILGFNYSMICKKI